MLPRCSDESKGLLISLDLRDDDYGYDESGNNIIREPKSASTICRFLFQRPSNYTRVMVDYKFNVWRHEEGLKDPFYEDVVFKHYSYHDSCWRSDGMEVLSKHWGNVQNYFDCHPNDKRLSRFYTFNMFDCSTGIQLIRFDKMEDVTERNNNKYGLTNYVIGYNVRLSKWEEPKDKKGDIK